MPFSGTRSKPLPGSSTSLGFFRVCLWVFFLQLDLSESDFWQSLLFTPKRQGPSESSPFQELSKAILTYLLSNLKSSPVE